MFRYCTVYQCIYRPKTMTCHGAQAATSPELPRSTGSAPRRTAPEQTQCGMRIALIGKLQRIHEPNAAMAEF